MNTQQKYIDLNEVQVMYIINTIKILHRYTDLTLYTLGSNSKVMQG